MTSSAADPTPVVGVAAAAADSVVTSTETVSPQVLPAGSVAAPEPPDGLVQPISFESRYGAGADRTIVLGGGGLYFVAWQIAYLNGLVERGVDLDRAEIVVGTSAGSIVAAILAHGRLHRFGVKVELLAKFPSLVSAIAPASNLHPSQLRAMELFGTATDAEPETVKAIGHAALAARSTPAGQLQRSVGVVMGVRKWRSDSLQISTVDTYTGERLVLRREHGLTVPLAAAASASVPGLFQPQLIGDRRCMDGGISGTGTHTDRVAGASRALVVSLVGGETSIPGGMTNAPDGPIHEIARLRETGTDVFVAGPGGVDVTRLMDPAAVGQALELGAAQAETDAPKLFSFWNA